MSSSVPAVKAALVSVLTAALPSCQVIYGPATSLTVTKARLLTVGRVVGRSALDSLGAQSRSETYTVELTVSVDLPGVSQQAATEQALADYHAAEAAVLADLTLGITAMPVAVTPTGDFELAEQADETGRHAAVRFQVSVYAQTA